MRLLLTSVVAILLILPASTSVSEINPNLVRNRWKASWITCPDSPQCEFGVYYFRKSFDLASVPQHFTVHVSGDQRYELFVNGTRAMEGPARGDLFHWRFETIDLAPHLAAGRNVLAAIVWNFADRAPMAQMTSQTGFLLQGDTDAEEIANTGKSWKVFRDTAWEMLPRDPQKVNGYFVVGPGERIDGSKVPWGWQQPDYNDSDWKDAVEQTAAASRGAQDSPSRWMLTPRAIPPMEEKLERLAHVVRKSGIEVGDDFLAGRAPVTVPANSRITMLFDQSYETTGYPELVVSGGRGAEITQTYAEALVDDRGEKGNRGQIEGKKILGFQDVFLVDGGPHRVFRPLWWRTWRYFQIEVVTHDEPLTIEDLRPTFTAYPFVRRASFASDDPQLEKMWEVGWRTARLCAHETYMDCPYYEQLQYAGDTRIQALISLYLTGDDRLAKNAIELLNESRTPDGITQSRYPSYLPQYIPPFSLLWIGMMHDLWWYRGDADFLRQFVPNMRGVLGWFETRLTTSGLLGRLEWWDFADWNDNFKDGVPPQESDGQSAILSLQFASILREAADLEQAVGSAEQAAHDRALAARIAATAYKLCWDPARALLADTPAKKAFSQHANILGVLADAIPRANQKVVIEKVLKDQSLTQCSYYFRFYLFRAMKKAGLGNDYLSQLNPWRHMLDLGLTTWAETPEPTRSDCHAWSAHPNFDFLATVAGIESAAPGFGKVKIEPHLGSLTSLEATMPHPLGNIIVRYKRSGEHLDADITIPNSLPGTVTWNGKTVELHEGSQQLSF